MSAPQTERFLLYHDAGPDSFGRRSFTLFWHQTPDGLDRTKRAQCFRCDPSRFSDATIITSEWPPGWEPA